jgi:hypothetical protein
MIEAKEKPKWYQIRWKLSNIFVKIAYKIYPESPNVKGFWMQQIMDGLILGESIIRVNPEETHEPGTKKIN